jgi:peptide/nickel transport system permease protein
MVRVRFLMRRLLMLGASLLVASFLIFASMYVAPGNPVAVLTGGRSISPEALQALEQRYHLDEPFLLQYWEWLTQALRGDLGTSIQLREDVSTVIAERAWITLSLVLYASILIVIIGVGLGLVAGVRPGRMDTSVLVVSSLAAAIPAFVAAIVLTLVFAVTLGWFPSMGTGHGFVDNVWHLTLPAVALAVSSIAIVARVTRAAIREEAGKEHVQTAVSRGIPRHHVLARHVLRNAAIYERLYGESIGGRAGRS